MPKTEPKKQDGKTEILRVFGSGLGKGNHTVIWKFSGTMHR
jgi:hypothetical protein